MTRFTLLLPALVFLMSLTIPPITVRGQDTDLSSYLPERDQLPPDLMVVDNEPRTLDAVANTFPDPVTAKQRLEAWGWQENVVLELAPTDPSSAQLSQVQISLHRFETETGAAEAMAYFVTERAAGLGLQEANTTAPPGNRFRVIQGDVAGGYESTVYAQAGPIVVRVTARQDDVTRQPGLAWCYASGQASNILDAILGFGHYSSPQFGYEIEWRKSVWPHAESTSIPGVRDELLLSSDDATLLYRGDVAAPNAQPPPDAVPLPGGRGMITRTSSFPVVDPLPGGIVSEDWAAAADRLPPQAPPNGLDALPTEGLTADRIGQAAPQAAGRLVQTAANAVGPPGHWNVWVLRGGPTITYTDPGDASVRAELLVDDVAPSATANEAVRLLYNLLFIPGRFAEHGRADVRLDAPVPYVLTGSPERGYRLLFGTRDGNWVATVQAKTPEDLEALVRTLIADLT